MILLGVSKRNRQGQIIFTTVLKVSSNIAAVCWILLAHDLPDVIQPYEQSGQKFGKPAGYSPTTTFQELDHSAPSNQVLARTGQKESQTYQLPSGRRLHSQEVLVRRVVLKVVYLGYRPGAAGQGRMGRDVVHLFTTQPNLAPIPEALSKLLSSSYRHESTPQNI